MSFTAEQKSQLAKLLATENLTVQHQKLSTAQFDVTNRVLYLPIWQNMTGVIYDLLVGHEVGHALYTPAEGWHDAVTDDDKNRNYKNFLNVIEDARIEKKIKRKYPGLNSAFKQAYAELMRRDFFGVCGRDVNEMAFIDRLNLFSKSQWTYSWIRFTAQEEVLVKEVQAAETWDDVVRITNKIYQYSKDEQHEMALQQYNDMLENRADSEDDYDDFGDDYGDDDSEGDLESKNSSNSGDKDFKEGESDTKNAKASDEESGDEIDESGKQINREKLSSPGDKDQFEPECETDETYRRNENKLLDDKCKEFIYVDIPKPIMKNIITPAKTVQELMTEFYKKQIVEKNMSATLPTELVNDFKRRNERYISLLAKEFEMRKAAKAFSKSKLSDTGDIDINKLSSYKFDDNIFRKVMLTPKGKNHGLVLLLDCSGSMSRNMPGSIEQILVLSMFCRKVNIPFTVYGFTENGDVRGQEIGLKTYDEKFQFSKDYVYTEKYKSFTQNIGEMNFGNVHLREYLNSQMSNAEFSNALKNMCLLMTAYKESREARRFVYRPDSERLNNTPMVQAIVATAEVMKDFKRKNNLDICSLVVVHDGDADGLNSFHIEKDTVNNNTELPMKEKKIACYEFHNKVYYMRDRQNKFEKKIVDFSESISQNILYWFQQVTGARVFGFFIIPGGRGYQKAALSNRYFDEKGNSIYDIKSELGFDAAESKMKELLKQFKDEKFVATKLPGYNNFFLIQGGEELTTDDDDEIAVEGKFTARKLATAFAKYNKKRAVNRVLVSRFIEGIAA